MPTCRGSTFANEVWAGRCPAPPIEPGLPSEEAARRLAEYGPNAVAEDYTGPARWILRHFWAPVPWMLEATIALQLAIGERVEALMVATLLIINVALGVFQESRADAALALLKQRLALRVHVKRDGGWSEINAAGLVPGDLVEVSLGAVVPADLRLISGTVLLDQSMLTGEPPPAEVQAGKTAWGTVGLTNAHSVKAASRSRRAAVRCRSS
jgi:H+-transporting ATPase